MNLRHGDKLVKNGVCSPEDVNTVLRHLGRDLHARHSFLSLLSTIGGDRGLQGGVDLSASIAESAISIVFFSLMKKLYMPDRVANAVGKTMSRLLSKVVPAPSAEWLESSQAFEDMATLNGKLDVQSGLFQVKTLLLHQNTLIMDGIDLVNNTCFLIQYIEL